MSFIMISQILTRKGEVTLFYLYDLHLQFLLHYLSLRVTLSGKVSDEGLFLETKT